MSALPARLDPRRRPEGAIDARALDSRWTGLARAVRAAEGRLPDGPVRTAEAVLRRADERLALAPGLTVVALAGPTGAGKSTLFNALVGEAVARVAVTRPTTGEPMASLWTTPGEAGPLLEWLGVARWHVVAPDADSDDLTGLVLIDLPDHDSTLADHRAHVDRLVERVDVMIWVLDPQKYADALVHDAYLKRFARHAEVTVVLLNQVDRLAGVDAQACLRDLRALVTEDGLPGAQVAGVSALTGQGLADVRLVLTGAAAERRAAMIRLAADIATAADTLGEAAGGTGPAVGPAPAGADSALADALTRAAGVGLIEDAVRASVRLQGGRRTGWPPIRWVTRLRRDPLARLRLGRPGLDPALVRTSLPSASPISMAQVTGAAREYAATVSAGAAAPWVRSTRAAAVAAAEGIGPQLDAAVARAEVGSPRSPGWWSVVGALQWLVVVLAGVGGVWLLGLVGLAALAMPAPDPPTVSGLPVPTALLVAGCVVGLAMALLAGLATRLTAGRAARRARQALTRSVSDVARSGIAEPVSEELTSLAEFRVGLAAALGE